VLDRSTRDEHVLNRVSRIPDRSYPSHRANLDVSEPPMHAHIVEADLDLVHPDDGLRGEPLYAGSPYLWRIGADRVLGTVVPDDDRPAVLPVTVARVVLAFASPVACAPGDALVVELAGRGAGVARVIAVLAA
jgi:hypothetical protein